MYCIKCGKEIENDSYFCMYCGENISFDKNEIFKEISQGQEKNTLKLSKTNFLKNNKKMIIITVALSSIIITVSIFLFIQVKKNENLIGKNADLIQKTSFLEYEVKDKDSTIISLKDKMKNNNESAIKIAAKAMFMDDYIALVNDNSEKYHTLDCEDFDSSSFMAYNIDAAEEMGYYPCTKCHK